MSISRLTNVTNFDALLGEIRTFINATGDWTIHENLRSPSTGAAAGGRELIASNGDVLAGLRSTTTGVGADRLYLFDGVPAYASSDIDEMNGNSGIRADADIIAAGDPTARCFNPQFTGPFPTATLFSDDPSTYCHVVVEVVAGRFRHLLFGNLIKFGTWTGGAYYSMMRWNQSAAFVDRPGNNNHTTPFDSSQLGQGGTSVHWTLHFVDGAVSWRCPAEATLNSIVRLGCRGSARGGFGHAFTNIAETPYSALIALMPVTVWPVTIADTPPTQRCAGQVPDIATVNMRNLIPGESYFIGADEWVVFPTARKSSPALQDDTENSGDYGIAYRVIP